MTDPAVGLAMAFRLRIGSRPSALALAQARTVAAGLTGLLPGLAVEIIPVRTSGDKMTTAALAQVGGKGLFIRELEQALSAGRIDLAVHSMKDLPAVLPPAFRIAAVPPRAEPADVLITRTGAAWDALPAGARLGTSSLRRRLQALRIRPDLEVQPLRGNIDTRLERLATGAFDGIILAMAGLERLNRFDPARMHRLDQQRFVPCGGQGALAIEAGAAGPIGGAQEVEAAIARLNHRDTAAEIMAERAFLAALGATCVTPLGVKGTLEDATLHLHALLFSRDGSRSLEDEIVHSYGPETAASSTSAPSTFAPTWEAGRELAARMLARGAGELLEPTDA